MTAATPGELGRHLECARDCKTAARAVRSRIEGYNNRGRKEGHMARLDIGKRFKRTNITQTVPNVSSYVHRMPEKY